MNKINDHHFFVKGKCAGRWKSILFIFMIFNLMTMTMVFGQLGLDNIDLKRIHQKKVRQLLHNQYLHGIRNLNDLSSACYRKEDSMKYRLQSNIHKLNGEVGSVWMKIRNIKPRDEFNGRMVTFGMMYSRRLNKVFYCDDEFSGLEEGEILFVNLKILGGIKNLGVALEVTKVDEENRMIQFCYLRNGVSEGTQQVSLGPAGTGCSLLTQQTRYKSSSRFRDKNLYPRFHKKALEDIYRNLSRVVETK